MSFEFHDSFHLRSNNQEDGIYLLHRAGLAGFVLKPENDWVTLLPQDDFNAEVFDKMIETNEGRLLHYYFSDLDGIDWGFHLFDCNQEIFSYEGSDNGDEAEIDDSDEVNIQALFDCINSGDAKKDKALWQSLQEYFYPEDENWLYDWDRPYYLAKKIGLKHFEISYQHVLRSLQQEQQSEYQDAILVHKK